MMPSATSIRISAAPGPVFLEGTSAGDDAVSADLTTHSDQSTTGDVESGVRRASAAVAPSPCALERKPSPVPGEGGWPLQNRGLQAVQLQQLCAAGSARRRRWR